MAINKNFVVKHGLEVNNDLILANADTSKVGIATTNPGYDLHVNGGIGATDVYVSGIATVKTNLVLNGLLTVNASAGSTGQYLKSTSTGVEWASFPALRTSSSFSATTGQTTFSFAYTVGLLDVYVNGVKLASTEFTASDGVSVVLANPCFGGEFVEIIGYAANSVGAGVSGIAGITILEEGSITGNTGGVTSINFVGAAVTAVGTGAGVTVYITDTAGGGGSSQWETTSAGINTLSNVGIGTTNPTSTLTVDGTLSVSGVSTFSNSVKLPDNTSIFLGNNSDLQIYHDFVNGNIIRDIDDKLTLDTGYFAINADSSAGRFAAVQCPSSTGEVQLRHPSGLKLQIKEFGINVIGITSTDQLSVGDVYDVNTGSGTFTATAGIAYTADSFTISSTDFKTVEYTLHIGYGSSIQAQKVLAIQNGTNAYSQEYAIMYEPSAIVSVAATITSGEFRLHIIPEVGVNGITTYRFARQSML